MPMSEGALQRIFEAADALHADSGHTKAPTVDAVRKRAQVNMNDASEGMKIWRRQHKGQDDQVPAQIPEDLQPQLLAALAPIWQAASVRAADALRKAREDWVAEREEAENLHREIAGSYDDLEKKFQSVEETLAVQLAQNEALRGEVAILRAALTAAERERSEALAATREASIRNEGLGSSVKLMEKSLKHAREELATLRAAHAGELDRLRTQARHDVEQANAAMTLALQECAALRGQLTARPRANGKPPGLRKEKATRKAREQLPLLSESPA